jgi:hypothetical protein
VAHADVVGLNRPAVVIERAFSFRAHDDLARRQHGVLARNRVHPCAVQTVADVQAARYRVFRAVGVPQAAFPAVADVFV